MYYVMWHFVNLFARIKDISFMFIVFVFVLSLRFLFVYLMFWLFSIGVA